MPVLSAWICICICIWICDRWVTPVRQVSQGVALACAKTQSRDRGAHSTPATPAQSLYNTPGFLDPFILLLKCHTASVCIFDLNVAT